LAKAGSAEVTPRNGSPKKRGLQRKEITKGPFHKTTFKTNDEQGGVIEESGPKV